MKTSSVFLIVILAFSSCKSNYSNSIKKNLLHERPLVKNIITSLLNKASLCPIVNGVDSFEIRIWYPFYRNDSFPGILERYFYQDGFKGEIYFFLNEKSERITTKRELNNLLLEKFEQKNIPIRFLDSLRMNYNLGAISAFDIKKFQDDVQKNPYDDLTAQMVLLEQASNKTYYEVFISDPTIYPGRNASVDKYASFARFVRDSLTFRDSIAQKWYNKMIDKVFKASE